MDQVQETSTMPTASYNQLHLVAVKLEILEDEIKKLSQSLEQLCDKVIQMGSNSVKQFTKKEQAMEKFQGTFDTTLKLIQNQIVEMAEKTKCSCNPIDIPTTSSSSHHLSKVVTSVQNLSENKKQLQDLIQVYYDQMNEIGNIFIKDQKGNFSLVSQTLENSLIFIMEKRAEFGGDDLDRVLRSQFLNMIKQYSSSSRLDLDSTNSVGKLLDRMNKLEERMSTNKATTTILSHTLPQALSEIKNLKDFAANTTETLEHFRCIEERIKEFDSEADIAMIKGNMALMEEDIEELKFRFESFLRAFTASKTENVKNFINFDRRMSDVESKGLATEVSHRSTQDEQSLPDNNQERKLSLAEKIHLTVAERCNSVIVEKDTEVDDVFDQTQISNQKL